MNRTAAEWTRSLARLFVLQAPPFVKLSRSFKRGVRILVLVIILSIVYLIVVSPIGWHRRRNRMNMIANAVFPPARLGWKDNQQSTSDMPIFQDNGHHDMARQYDGDKSVVMLQRLFISLRPIAEAPKESEPRFDLYVMF